MCGINGILHFSGQNVQEDMLLKMRDVLVHRGPDDAGIHIDKSLGFGHRRLSIIDTSSAGQQPFFSKDRRYCIIFNGEIYNYQSFYKEIEAKGLDIRSATDTEVLLKLFKLYGMDFLHRLKGMFAFAIWDSLERRLYLARDRMGVKPLYYAFYNNSLYFASEQKALFAAGVPAELEEEGLSEYFYNRFVAGENTLFKRVKKILPGHYITIELDGYVKYTRWWHLKERIENFPHIANPKKWFEETFFESVRYRMVSDVPVGVLLSGGLDSSAIAGSLYTQDFKNINTFTIAFDEAEHNEAHLAKNLTRRFGYNYHQVTLDNNSFFEYLTQAIYFNDEPLMHLNEPHLLAVAKLAQQNVKVLLSGEGSDELMGGYLRYKPLQQPNLLKVLSGLNVMGYFIKNQRYKKLLRYATIDHKSDLVLFNSSNIFPKDNAQFLSGVSYPDNYYRKTILAEAKELYPNNLRRQALYLDQHTYLCSLLDRNDRCTMGASVECREPFLDEELIAGLGTLPDNWLFTGSKGKYILKKTMQNILPAAVLNFKKVGLSAPWDLYLQNIPEMRAELEALRTSAIFEWELLENIDISKLLDQYRAGMKHLLPYVKTLLLLHMWHAYYFKQL